MAYEKFNYPVQLNLENQPCLVVGGGAVASRKVRSLLEAGARVTVVAPDIVPGLEELSSSSLILEKRPFKPGDCSGFFLVVAATDRPDVNRTVTEDARSCHCLVNCTDNPDAGNFTVSGSHQCGQLAFAVSTGGNPRLTRLILDDLRETYGPQFGEFLSFLAPYRSLMQQCLPRPEDRQAFWRRTLTRNLLQLVKAGQLDKAKEIVIHAVNSSRTQP